MSPWHKLPNEQQPIYWSYSKLNHIMYDLSQLNNGF